MIKSFTDDAWDEYCSWQDQDRKTLRRINLILKDIDRNGYEGIGKPEPLKDKLTGYWSRRIDDYHRIVYKIEGGIIKIIQCGTHYRE